MLWGKVEAHLKKTSEAESVDKNHLTVAQITPFVCTLVNSYFYLL